MDLPTLFFMTSFSVFIYYFAKLTMQVEKFKQKGGKSLLIGGNHDNEDGEGFDEKRVHLLGGGIGLGQPLCGDGECGQTGRRIGQGRQSSGGGMATLTGHRAAHR